MALKKKKSKDVDINIKVKNLGKLVKEGKKWEKEKCNCDIGCHMWKSSGMGFWGFGSALAMILSYAKSSSILWAILHGIFSWFYIIYRILIDYHLFGL